MRVWFSRRGFSTEIDCLGSHNHESVHFRSRLIWLMKPEIIFFMMSFAVVIDTVQLREKSASPLGEVRRPSVSSGRCPTVNEFKYFGRLIWVASELYQWKSNV
jgi:hypothetical protein